MDKVFRIEDFLERLQRAESRNAFKLLPSVYDDVVEQVESKLGSAIPDDFRKFYSFCNGTTESVDEFRIITLEEFIKYDEEPERRWKAPWEFPFGEYAFFSNVWAVSIDKNNRNNYTIYTPYKDDRLYYTNSLAEFLERYLDEGIYDGIYKWGDEIIRNRQRLNLD